MTSRTPIRWRLPVVAVAVLTTALAAGSWPAAVLAATPTAVDDAAVVQEDAGPTTIDVLHNDTITAGDTITDIPSAASHGTVAIAGDGQTVTYAPDGGYHGPDTFTYTVTNTSDGDATATVTVKVNAPPVAVDDPAVPGCAPDHTTFGGSFPVVEDAQALVIGAGCNLTANDTDADGSIVAWDVTTGPAHGTIDWLPGQPGIVSYTPDPDYNTPSGTWVSDTITYQAIDDDGARSNEATLSIWVAPVNDAPSFSPGQLTVHGTEDVPYSAAWATSISPGPPDESSQTVHFVLSGDTNPGLFSTLPTVASDGTLSFTPASNASGSATLTVKAKDDGGLEDYNVSTAHPADTSAPVTLTIVVDSDNDPPTATDDNATIAEDAPSTLINVLGNDTDPESDALSITGTGAAALGTVTHTATTVHYQPNPDANGTDSFTYTIDDGHGGSASATVHVTITPVNDAPKTLPDTLTVNEDQTTASAVSVLDNDSDVEGDTLAVTAAGGATKGVVTFTSTSVRYKPNANAFGGDTITYTVSDGHGGTASGTVAVTITPSNDPPNAVNDGVPTALNVYVAGGAQALPVLANDTWLPDAPETLTIIAVTKGSHGTVAISGGGSGLTYTPLGTTTGIDVFTYTISDGHGATDTASVVVNVAKDTITPKVGQPTVTATHVKGRTTTQLQVRWTITETQSGLAWEQVQIQTNGGAWTSLKLTSSAVRTLSVTVHIDRSIRFRVRAADRAGHTAAFVLSHTIRT